MDLTVDDPGPQPVRCDLCGVTEQQLPLTWMTEFDAARGPRHYCDRCARDNLRAVESKLPHQWW